MRAPIALLALCLSVVAQAAPSVYPWSLPAPDGAAQPHLHAAPDGRLWLSWIERQPKGHRLQVAHAGTDGSWTAPRTVAAGERWFVNWADVPAVAVTADGAAWTHTLEKSAEATYAYDVVLRRSDDGGANWSVPRIAHEDGTQTEHGFASLFAWGPDELGVVWLDGRNTGGGHDAHAGQHGGGAMTLRGAVFNAAMEKRAEWELDASTCDCCQTTVAQTTRGPVVVYRDRAEGEIRDIYATRFDGAGWTQPRRVHADDWFMPACPVNGPAAAALGDQLWVAWYTAAGGMASLRLAHSRSAGDDFATMREVSRGEALLGRVAVAAEAGGVWLAWLEEREGAQSLWLARYVADLSAETLRLKVADVAGRGRGTGFPRLVLSRGQAHLVWTEVVNGQPRLRGARVAAE